MGLSSVDAQAKKSLITQIKNLGNYYINGIQTAFNNLLLEMDAVQNGRYTRVIDQINYISALLKKSQDYLNAKKENPEEEPELNSAIEEQIGYIWKLTDLMQYGLYEEDAEIIQLSFNSYDNSARREYVDESDWLNLKTGKLYKIKNYRPYRASKYIKEDNSVFDVLKIKELFIYPGDMNQRIRWESAEHRDVEKRDIEKIHQFASTDYAALIKAIKASIKNPLMDKNPVVLMSLNKVYVNGEHLVLEDKQGSPITLRDIPHLDIDTEEVLKSVLPENATGMSLLVMIDNDVEEGLISAQPLSLITSEKIIRLLY
ncbi:MAG: hypothetical protein LIO65_05695 [Odoribacter sp.]|nr:hypothetical protein [Odoribacter sp.]